MATAGPDLQKLELIVERERERFRVPGVEVVVVRGGEVLFAGGFGMRNVESGLPVTSKTVFAHGSTAKASTAFLIGTLVDEGKLAWDEPVRTYLPAFKLKDPVASERVKVRDFLCHRSGVSRNDLAWLAQPDLTRAELVHGMRHLEPIAEFRTQFQYCNWGYMLLGYLAGVVAGSSYEEQMRESIFEPLGMTNTYLDTAAVLALDDHADPYQSIDDELHRIPYRNLASSAPAGGIMSCADDTARWLLCQLNGGELDGKRVISDGSLRETQIVQMPMDGAGGTSAEDSVLNTYGYGMGWMVGTYRGRRHLAHQGGLDGFTTEFELLPDEKIGVAVSNNLFSYLPLAVARNIVDLLLGEEPKDWGAEIDEQVKQGQAAAEEQAKRGPPRVQGTPPSHPLTEYAGSYDHPAYGPLSMHEQNGGLAAKLGALEFEASYRHFDTWDLTWLRFPEIQFWATFLTDVSGSVSEVRTNFEPGLDHITFTRSTETND